MGRPLTYVDRAAAGAATLGDMEARTATERMFQYRVNRDAEEDLRRDRQEERMFQREDRAQESEDLLNEVRRYNLEKEKAFDANQRLLRRDLDRQAIEGNQALRDISLDDEDAENKLSQWGVKYFRLLDPEIGDKRLQQHYAVNQRLLERRRIEREKDATLRKAQELARDQGLKLKSITGDTPTYSRDEPTTTLSTSEESLSDDPSTVLRTNRRTTTGPASQLPATSAPLDTPDKFRADLKTMVDSYGGKEKVPAKKWAEFEDRKARLQAQPASSGATTTAPTGREFLDQLGIKPRAPRPKPRAPGDRNIQAAMEG